MKMSNRLSNLMIIVGLVLIAALMMGCAKLDVGGVACTKDAKICPDGSNVGRTGPNCEFAACPGANDCTCPQGYRQEGETCNPECYYNEPRCLLPSVQCERKNGDGNVQIANPASVYCEQQGGNLKIVDTPDGQQGICKLKDGTECDEWAYFRGECPSNAPQRHICTEEEKANKACTLDYTPVCGNEGVTYGNGCGACAAGVTLWTPGECPN
jgi:putative hemolysin